MDALLITLAGFARIAWNFSPVLIGLAVWSARPMLQTARRNRAIRTARASSHA